MGESAALVKYPDGSVKEVKLTKSPKGYRDFYKLDSRAAKLLDESGIMKYEKIGAATVGLMSTRACVLLFWDKLLEDPLLVLGRPGEDPFCDEWAEKTIEHVKSGGAGERP